jgi:hypothetical protein
VSGEMDRQLRDLLEAAVGEPPHRVTVETVRRRVVRRRVTDGVAAAAAALLIAGMGVVISAVATGPGPAGSRGLRVGEPAFYLQQTYTEGSAVSAVVRDTATGAVTGTVRCPGQQSQIAPGDIAAASHETFFVACETTGQGRTLVVTRSRIYRFQITGGGRITGWSPVPGGVLDRLRVRSIAASSDGSEVAVATGPGPLSTSALEDILIINARTGTRAVWHNNPHERGAIGNIHSLSLTSGGRELVFVGTPGCVTLTVCLTRAQQVRALIPATAGGQLDSSRLLGDPNPLLSETLNDVVVSPDGSTLTFVLVHSPGRGPDSLSVVQASPVTGNTIRVLYRVITGNGFTYRFFSSDPSGRYLLLIAGPTTATVNGWIDHGRLVPLAPADGNGVLNEIW